MKQRIDAPGIRFDRVPPQDMDAERAVLGAMIIGGTEVIAQVLKHIGETLTDLFYHVKHQYICGAILRLYDKNEPVDLVTLSVELQREDELSKAGDVPYLDEMIDASIVANVLYHCDIIKECYIKRQLIRMSVEIYNKAFDYSDDPKELLKQSSDLLDSVMTLSAGEACEIKTIAMAQEEYEWFINHLAEYTIKTGFWELDNYMRFAPPDIWTVIGHTGIGKSILAQNIALYAWELSRIQSLYVSYEMMAYSLYERMASISAVRHPKEIEEIYRDGTLIKDDIARKVMAQYGNGIHIIDKYINLFEIGYILRAFPNIRLIILDYIQIMPSTSRSDNKHEKISAITDRLKEFCKEHNVAVIMLSQILKGVNDPYTELKPSDSRESGTITDVADGVLGIWGDKNIESMRYCGILKSRHFSRAVGKKIELAFTGESPLLKCVKER
jgi:replicative DNA helicase